MSLNPIFYKLADIFGCKLIFPSRNSYGYSLSEEISFRTRISAVCNERGFRDMLSFF